MSSSHVTGEQLALLAMAADVDDAVAEHVASCPACTKDLSLITSLLNADGPDSDSSHEGVVHDPPDDPSRLPAQAFTAMADTADGRTEPDRPPSTGPADVQAAPGVVGTGSAGQRQRTLAVVAALIAAAALIVVVAVLWR